MSPEQFASTGAALKWLLGLAWLLPLAGFCIEVLGGYWTDRRSRAPAWLAVGCIGGGFVLSTIAFVTWGSATHWGAFAVVDDHHGDAHARGQSPDAAPAAVTGAQAPAAPAEHGHPHDGPPHGHDAAHASSPYAFALSGSFYNLATFGGLSIDIDYYIDSLTIVMFMMVTLIATCIHLFAMGYMSDELTDNYEDHEVHLPGGRHFHRPGRYYRFFSYLSLFCFAMLGLVLAGNIFQVFVFWELVGVCSYLLIGFYVERKSASTAANKAFVMNRVGDFGFLIGLMILWTWFGTFRFANTDPAQPGAPGLFQMVRDADGHIHEHGAGLDRAVVLNDGLGGAAVDAASGQPRSIPFWLLIAAGLGIFAGCIGKSAQFPLQTWLPDAMEGPTPVSALVHSATMVAAGVYLAGRFYPMFVPEVLLVIAYIGCITLFIGATIAIVVTDIKRVLAYSTISQLGYMMLALGVGGWFAGLFHLITHAFFKSLMFLASGSVIHGCHHVQDMQEMGGLRRKMPITAWAMLVGVIAIAGLAIPTPWMAIAFSGYHSKDAILATSLAFMSQNRQHFLLFLLPLATAGITAFYMFRLWFMTFSGKPRNQHVYDHAHESPWIMLGPLVILSVFAAVCAVGGEGGPLARMLFASEPTQAVAGAAVAGTVAVNLPGHALIHEYHTTAGIAALLAALTGAVLSYVFYGAGLVNPATIRSQLSGLHSFLIEKWEFDALYDAMFVRPVHVVARWAQGFDQKYLDGFLHATGRAVVWISKWDRKFDETVVDRAVNVVGDATYAAGASLRRLQTGRLRQYVMFIAFGVLGLFLLMFAFLPR
ncbi:MAG: NADH-quinone oxidoreductase subunit L [Planctomyces sp.]|nr:NADH-quinone oxidoreductase subunit L [Planctomyces sp.]